MRGSEDKTDAQHSTAGLLSTWSCLIIYILFIFSCYSFTKVLEFWITIEILSTVELQWLEHLWNHENMFGTGLVCTKSGGIIGINFPFSLI